MFEEDLSPALQRAVSAARIAAARQGAAAVAPLHLLIALLADEESQASRLVARFGGSTLRAEAGVAEWPADDAHAHSDFPLADATRDILHAARECAAAGGHVEPTDSEDALAAAVREFPPAVAWLVDRRVDCTGLLADYDARRRPVILSLPAGDVDFNPKRSCEEADLARILDANFNRAREGLRVVEDYARFVRDDAPLSQRLKDCRHGLRAALSRMPFAHPIAARDVDGDVGAGIGADGETFRASLADVVTANCKRAQEAVRTLEEYSKIESPDAAAAFERIRYELYAVERLLAIGARAHEILRDARLYWLADPDRCAKDFAWTVEKALAGGVDVVQLRAKRVSDRELLALARDVRHQTQAAGALFIVNDRADIARLSRADGVHLGQDDLPIADARAIVGPDALIGISTHHLEQARRAVRQGADYIGVGPTFPSTTKSFEHFPGLDLVGQVASEIRVPAFAIGGIAADNLDDLLAVGGARIAVSAAIAAAADPEQAARQLAAKLSPI